MTLKTELAGEVRRTLHTYWTTRAGRLVPESESIRLGNDAVKLTGTVLYADLSESTAMVQGFKDWFAAKVYKLYLYCASRIIRSLGGSITAYDGDRVMGVFIGSFPNTAAAKCALQINWTVHHLIQPGIAKRYPGSSYRLKQVVGIDRSDLFIARTGIRGSNDLVWVGRAANFAAKMSGLPPDYSTYISSDVYGLLKDSSRYGGPQGVDMWTYLGDRHMGLGLYGSNWSWPVP